MNAPLVNTRVMEMLPVKTFLALIAAIVMKDIRETDKYVQVRM